MKLKSSKISFWGSFLMLISGALPFTDMLVKTLYPEIEGKMDARGFPITSDIWLCSLYLSPVFIIIAFQLKPHILTYFAPLFASIYTAVLYFIPILGYDLEPTWGLRILIGILIIPLIYIIKRVRNFVRLQEFKEKVIIDSLEAYVNDEE